MAYTATEIAATVFGNQRVKQYQVTADAASGSVATGFNIIDSCLFAPISAATAAFKVKRNLNDSSATANGTVFISSAVNGDVFFLTVFGR